MVIRPCHDDIIYAYLAFARSTCSTDMGVVTPIRSTGLVLFNGLVTGLVALGVFTVLISLES